MEAHELIDLLFDNASADDVAKAHSTNRQRVVQAADEVGLLLDLWCLDREQLYLDDPRSADIRSNVRQMILKKARGADSDTCPVYPTYLVDVDRWQTGEGQDNAWIAYQLLRNAQGLPNLSGDNEAYPGHWPCRELNLDRGKMPQLLNRCTIVGLAERLTGATGWEKIGTGEERVPTLDQIPDLVLALIQSRRTKPILTALLPGGYFATSIQVKIASSYNDAAFPAPIEAFLDIPIVEAIERDLMLDPGNNHSQLRLRVDTRRAQDARYHRLNRDFHLLFAPDGHCVASLNTTQHPGVSATGENLVVKGTYGATFVHPLHLPALAALLCVLKKAKLLYIDEANTNAILALIRRQHPSWELCCLSAEGGAANFALKHGKRHGPDDCMRRVASVNEYTATNYAEDIDKSWHPVTAAACFRKASGHYSIEYVKRTGSGEIPQIRAHLVNLDCWNALRWASEIDGGPRDDTRHTVTVGGDDSHSRAQTSLLYAANIDQGPHPETRAACLVLPETAFLYDLYILGRATADGRRKACELAWTAYLYAALIDGRLSPETILGITSGRIQSQYALTTTRSNEKWSRAPGTWKSHDPPGYRASRAEIVQLAARIGGAYEWASQLFAICLDDAGNYPAPLIEVLLADPALLDEPKVMNAAATPKVIAAMLNVNQQTPLSHELAQTILSDPRRRRKVLATCYVTGAPEIPRLVTKYIDGGNPRKDTITTIVRIAKANVYEARRYYDEVIKPRIPGPDLRLALGASGLSMHDLLNMSTATYRGSSGWRTEKRDFLHLVEEKIERVGTALASLQAEISRTLDPAEAEALDNLRTEIRIFARHSNRDSIELNTAISNATKHPSLRRILENDGYLEGIEWMLGCATLWGKMFATYYNEAATTDPLRSVIVSPDDAPKHVFVGITGPPQSDFRNIEIPSNEAISEKFVQMEMGNATLLERDVRAVSGGALSQGNIHGAAVDLLKPWWDGLDRPQKKLLARRIGATIAELDLDEVARRVSFLWGGSTVYDAWLWTKSPFVVEIDVKKIPLINYIEYRPQKDIVGWLLVLTGDIVQVTPPNRSTLYYR
jgi:hypothetical protein